MPGSDLAATLDGQTTRAAAAPSARAEPTSNGGGDKLDCSRIELRFVEPGTDWPALADARLRAFDGTAIDKRLYPPELRPAWAERVAAEARQAQLVARFPHPGVFHLCALVRGRPVGLATWHLKPDRRSTGGQPTAVDLARQGERKAGAEKAKDDRARAYEETLARPFAQEFKKALDAGRKGWAEGRPHWLLSVLCVHPDAQGLGVGRKLLEWGIAQADQRGLPVYLETSAAAQKLYASAGFEVVSTISWLDPADSTPFSMPVMVRPARTLPAGFSKPLPAVPRPQVALTPVEGADWADIARIKVLALGAEGVLFNGIWPRGRQPDLETRVAWLVRLLSLAAQFPSDETAFVKASIEGETVGFALWQSPVDRTATRGLPSPSERKRAHAAAEAMERAQGGPQDEARQRAFDGAFAGRWKRDSAALRAEALQGRPHWYLDTLGVHPDYQGHGIGRKLCEWGMKRADAAGIPCYLEASRLGRPLYDRLGFVVVGQIVAEPADGSCFSLPGMVRPPAGVR